MSSARKQKKIKKVSKHFHVLLLLILTGFILLASCHLREENTEVSEDVQISESTASSEAAETVNLSESSVQDFLLESALSNGMNNLQGFTVTLSSVTPQGCICTYSNQTSDTCTYGRSFDLYKYENEEWQHAEVIRNESVFSDALNLQPGDSVDKKHDFEYWYGELPPGRYLHLVSISRISARLEITTYYYGNEFTIQ